MHVCNKTRRSRQHLTYSVTGCMFTMLESDAWIPALHGEAIILVPLAKCSLSITARLMICGRREHSNATIITQFCSNFPTELERLRAD